MVQLKLPSNDGAGRLRGFSVQLLHNVQCRHVQLPTNLKYGNKEEGMGWKGQGRVYGSASPRGIAFLPFPTYTLLRATIKEIYIHYQY